MIVWENNWLYNGSGIMQPPLLNGSSESNAAPK